MTRADDPSAQHPRRFRYVTRYHTCLPHSKSPLTPSSKQRRRTHDLSIPDGFRRIRIPISVGRRYLRCLHQRERRDVSPLSTLPLCAVFNPLIKTIDP